MDEALPERWSTRYARYLLDELGFPAASAECVEEHPIRTWASSGLMALTGPADGPARTCPVPFTACADGALSALAALAPAGALQQLRGSSLLAERAALTGHRRQGAISPGGSCRLLRTRDGQIALNLARPDDGALLCAWLEQDIATDWTAVADGVAERSTAELIERGRMLGLALADVDASAGSREPPPSFDVDPEVVAANRTRRPLVLDLSSLWAGPLCAQLLGFCGAEVIKLESLARPDGARQGVKAFHDLLNAGKHSVALDLNSSRGREQLRDLILRADIVIEASRPRALRQLGIDAEMLLPERPGLSWISITGHGREEPRANWIAYGDDAGVAAGLSRIMRTVCGENLIVGDAIADPLTGIHAALFAWASWLAGGPGRLIPLSLVGTVRECIGAFAPESEAGWQTRDRAWRTVLAGDGVGPACPQLLRSPAGEARLLGADTAEILARLGIAC